MKITEVVKDKKNPHVMKIYIDGNYAFSMEEEDYLAQALYEKENITCEEIHKIKEVVNVKAIKDQAFRYLARKDYTEAEIFKKLCERGYEHAEVRNAILEIKSMGYIDDRIYARKYIAEKVRLKPKSKKALQYELRQKGIDLQIIKEAINDMDINDKVLAYRSAKKRFGKYDISELKIKRRIYSFLQHRGYDSEIISDVIYQLESESN